MDDPRSRFTHLYDEHYRRVLAYALTHADQGVAEDVVSETFLVAWRRLDDLPAAGAALAAGRTGSPELEEWSARPQTNDHDFPAAELTPEQRRSEPGEPAKLPTDEKALEKVLRGWHRATERQAIRHEGVPTGTSFAEFVFYEAENLLSGAARPSTRAAFYRLLAAQPGIVMGGRVTDLLGRGGVALAYRSAAGEQRLIIDPATAALLGREAYQPLKRGRAPIRVLAQAMVIEGWVGDIGERP
ncbi:sigma factor [Thermomonospora amylolytica]|uniref:sigma factor n=1 Tax=Thermomonospora amylolytica TaxID=1411117 RepID=UPI0018E53A01|nr:sigma factor [Thermomonospora amylolytica]